MAIIVARCIAHSEDRARDETKRVLANLQWVTCYDASVPTDHENKVQRLARTRATGTSIGKNVNVRDVKKFIKLTTIMW